jgi:crotonobetaine/carnitine-CoA ligase
MTRSSSNIRQVVERAVERSPDKVYLVCGDLEVTYLDFDRQVNRAANAFLKLGVRKGDRVALMLPNRPEFLYAWLGLNKIGASMVPINTAFKSREAQYVVDHSESRFLLADALYLDTLGPILSECNHLETTIVLDQAASGVLHSQPLREGLSPVSAPLPGAPGKFESYTELVADASDELAATELSEDDEASVLYTSGTTGHPKGCVEPHSYYLVGGQVYRRALGLAADDRVLTPLPLFHMNPQILSTMGTLLCGGSLVLVDRFHPSTWWTEVRRTRPSVFHYLGVMPAMLMGLPEQPDDADQPARLGIGAGVGTDVHERFERRFNCKLLEVFGMTEVGLNFCCPPEGERKVGTRCFCQVFPEYEARVVDASESAKAEDCEVPEGRSGELVLRGSDPTNRRRGFMREYLKNPEVTAEAWRGGWFHTGDEVRRDADGYYYFVDRRKDLIRRSGENISSSEVEAVIRSHPRVLDVAVIPVPDPIREEEVKAYVILNPGETPETCPPDELLVWCEDRLAYFKVPRYLEYRDSFPRTPTEKVQKQVLKTEREDLTTRCYDRLARQKPSPREESSPAAGHSTQPGPPR